MPSEQARAEAANFGSVLAAPLDSLAEAFDRAIAAEREACARIADDFFAFAMRQTEYTAQRAANEISRVIRNRNETDS